MPAFPLSIPEVIYAAICIVIAAFVRGYSGFGFSMISVISLSLIISPARIVPVILLLEIAASGWLLPSVWKDVHWRSLAWLSLGVLIGTPAGVYLLASLPQKPLQAGISVVIIVLVLLLWRGLSFRFMPGRPVITLTGIISGIFNGGAAIGGPPAVLFYFSTPTAAAASRASLIAYFFGTDVYAAAVCAIGGLLHLETLLLLGAMIPPMLIGLTLGQRKFVGTDEEKFRRAVLLLLAALSVGSLVKTFV